VLVFAISCGASPDVAAHIREAVARIARVVPNLDEDTIETRASSSTDTAVATVTHARSTLGPRRYLAEHGSETWFFDGLPVLMDGSLICDAEQLRGVSELDGAGVGVHVDHSRDRVEVITASLGLAPVYVASPAGGGKVLSNSVAALRWLLGLNEPDPLGLSSFLSLGWPASDRTLNAGIDALPGGSRITITRNGLDIDERFGPATLLATRSRSDIPDSKALAELFIAATGGLSAFEDVQCALTGGRDSRLLLALLRATGVEATYYTAGVPGEPDVDIAVAIARRLGLSHEVIPARSFTSADAERFTNEFIVQNDGLRSLEQVGDQFGEDAGIVSLGVKVSGVGGGIPRTGTTPLDALAANVRPLADIGAFQRRVLALKIDTSENLATPRAVALTREHLDAFFAARRAEGWRTASSTESFFLFERVERWGATSVRQAAPTADVFSPFFSRAFVEASHAGPSVRRLTESLHYELMTALDVELRDWPYQIPWPRQSARFAGVRSIAFAGRVLRKRIVHSDSSPGVGRPQAGRVARDWVADTAAIHLPVVERAMGSPLEELIHLDGLHRALQAGSRLGTGGLRALTAVWWFDTGRHGALASRA
jgi:asparagine synthase (glutamine-hydrolysing)